MCFRPTFPDLELPGRGAAQAEVTPRQFDVFHKELAQGVGDFRSGEELGFIMDVQYLLVVPTLPPFRIASRYFPMADDRGRLDQHGPGGLQEGVQGGMRGADVQPATVQTVEVRALVRAGEHAFDIFNQASESGERPQETMEPSFISPAPYMKASRVFGRGRCFLPVGAPQLVVADKVRLYLHPLRGPCASVRDLDLLLFKG